MQVIIPRNALHSSGGVKSDFVVGKQSSSVESDLTCAHLLMTVIRQFVPFGPVSLVLDGFLSAIGCFFI